MIMRNLLLIFLLVSFSFVVFGQSKSEGVIGTYRVCPYECEFIKFNKDFTFEYFREAHILPKQRTKGTWKFTKENKIHLTSPKSELIVQVKESKSETNKDKILVQVLDGNGAIVPGFLISQTYEGKKYNFVTDDDGTVEIFRTNEITFINLQQEEKKHKFKNKDINELEIIFIPDFRRTFEDFYLIKKNQICYTDDEGVSDFCYEKISKKESDKIFKKLKDAK